MRTTLLILALASATLLAVAACGQKGPLYRPSEEIPEEQQTDAE